MKKTYFLLLLSVMLSSTVLAQIHYVTEDGSGLKNGTSWADAYDKTQLQQAIDNAAEDEQVWVAKGIYTPTVNQADASIDPRDRAFLM